MSDVIEDKYRDGARKKLEELVRESVRKDWSWGRKRSATNVARIHLGPDDDGEDQFMILMDVDGKREHHRTKKLRTSGDIQSFDDYETDADENVFLERLSSATGKHLLSMICDAETLQLEQPKKNKLASILLSFIVSSLDSNNREVLIAAGAAIRKYVAILHIDRIGEVGDFLDLEDAANAAVGY